MTTDQQDVAALEIRCEDGVANKRYLYAVKARRKKIALVRVSITNRSSHDLQVLFATAQLATTGGSYPVEKAEAILRKLSEFTWDFVLYTILDFHPVLALIEASLFLSGPLYNRRLRRQLRDLTDADAMLKPGEHRTVLLAFRGVTQELAHLVLPYRGGDGEKRHLEGKIN